MAEALDIDHVGHRGDGVVLAGGGNIYVPYTLGGENVEVVDVPGHADRRRLVKIERASPERIDAFCPHFSVCGGCAIQHWEAERYRDWKRRIVVEGVPDSLEYSYRKGVFVVSTLRDMGFPVERNTLGPASK